MIFLYMILSYILYRIYVRIISNILLYFNLCYILLSIRLCFISIYFNLFHKGTFHSFVGYYPSVNIKCTLLLHLLSIPRLSSQSFDWFLSKCVLRNFTPYDISGMTMISHWICNCYSVVHQVCSWLAYILSLSANLQNILSWSKKLKTYSLTVFMKKRT